MADYNAGSLYYTVDAKLGPLLKAEQAATQSTQRLGDELGKTTGRASAMTPQITKTASAVRGLGDASVGASSSMMRLVGALGSLLALQGVGGLLQLSESYNEMAERVKMATASTEEYIHVQERLLTTANGTYRALSEAQEVFITTSATIKTMGYNTDEALDIVDSLSYSFVRNATSSQKAQSALNAVSNSFATGKVNAMAWNTIFQATPSILADVANATGKTEKEILNLGSSGQLTAKMLSEGLRKSLDENKKAADEMATTIGDAFTNLRNQLSVFVGESSAVTGATQLISKSVQLLGDNLNEIASVVMVTMSAALGRYIAVQAAAMIASMKAGLEARKQAAEELVLATQLEKTTGAAAKAAAANVALGGSHADAANKATAHAAAAARLEAAKNGVVSVGSKLLGILGGPVGIIAMLGSAALSMAALGNNAKQAKVDIDFLTISINELGDANLRLTKTKLIDKIDEMKSLGGEAAKSGARIEFLKRQLEQFPNSKEAGNWAKEMMELDAKVETANETLAAHNEILEQINKLEQERASKAANAPDSRDPEADKKLADLRSELELVKLQGVARAKLQAIQKLGANATKEQREEAEKLAAQIYEIEEKRKASTKATTASIKESTTAAKENAKTIKDMERELFYASLSGEALAKAKAMNALNEFATQAEIDRVKELAAQLYAVSEAEKLREKVGNDPNKYIRGDVSPLSGGAFDDQTARYDAEAVKEQERYDAQLARLQEALDSKKLAYEESNAVMESLAEEHASRMDQIDAARKATQYAAVSSSFGAIADVMKTSLGEQSGIYKAMFAASKAFAIAESIIKIQQGIASAAALPFPANIPAMATVAAQTAGIVATIQGTSFGGGRFYGGAVDGNKVYRVNEGGSPEIFNAADGHQYMMPNKKGEVISNRDATAGVGSPKVTVILNEDASKAGQVNTDYNNEETVISICVSNVMGDGALGDAIGQKFGVRGQGQ